MTRRKSMVSRAMAQLMNPDNPAYGDERERAIGMEAASFGLSVSIYVGFVGAVLASLFGFLLLPVVVLALAVIPSVATIRYARGRGVDLYRLTENSGMTGLVATVAFGTGMVVSLAAMTYRLATGTGLLSLPSLDVVPGEGVLGGAVYGAVIGGMIGGLATIVGGVYSYRRTVRRREGTA